MILPPGKKAGSIPLALELDPAIRVERVYHQLLADGFLVGYYSAANILRFDPALTIEEAHIRSLLEALEKILSEN